jgi:hypothetical protein
MNQEDVLQCIWQTYVDAVVMQRIAYAHTGGMPNVEEEAGLEEVLLSLIRLHVRVPNLTPHDVYQILSSHDSDLFNGMHEDQASQVVLSLLFFAVEGHMALPHITVTERAFAMQHLLRTSRSPALYDPNLFHETRAYMHGSPMYQSIHTHPPLGVRPRPDGGTDLVLSPVDPTLTLRSVFERYFAGNTIDTRTLSGTVGTRGVNTWGDHFINPRELLDQSVYVQYLTMPAITGLEPYQNEQSTQEIPGTVPLQADFPRYFYGPVRRIPLPPRDAPTFIEDLQRVIDADIAREYAACVASLPHLQGAQLPDTAHIARATDVWRTLRGSTAASLLLESLPPGQSPQKAIRMGSPEDELFQQERRKERRRRRREREREREMRRSQRRSQRRQRRRVDGGASPVRRLSGAHPSPTRYGSDDNDDEKKE